MEGPCPGWGSDCQLEQLPVWAVWLMLFPWFFFLSSELFPEFLFSIFHFFSDDSGQYRTSPALRCRSGVRRKTSVFLRMQRDQARLLCTRYFVPTEYSACLRPSSPLLRRSCLPHFLWGFTFDNGFKGIKKLALWLPNDASIGQQFSRNPQHLCRCHSSFSAASTAVNR